jgi:hypothetical protein
VWKVSGEEKLRLGSNTLPSDIFPEEPLNFFIQNVTVGDSPLQTTFVSYLWFNSSKYPATNVTCEKSVTERVTIALEAHDGVYGEKATSAENIRAENGKVVTFVMLALYCYCVLF